MGENRVARIHRSAVISREAEISPDARIGACCVIEGAVRVEAGCVLEANSHLIGPLILGARNRVCGGAVLGAPAQHLRKHEPKGLEIGAHNLFRSKATVHQGMEKTTRIGSGNQILGGAHVGHDCQVGDGCRIASGALLGGHCAVDDGVRLGSRSAIHQFCRLGRLCRLRDGAVTTKDVPPFIVQRDYNTVVGLNATHMTRVGLSLQQIDALRQLYRIVYLQRRTLSHALAEVERLLGEADVVQEFIRFARVRGRGLNGARLT